MMREVIVAVLVHASLTGFVNCIYCPDTWIAFQNSCYLFGHHETMSFFDAEVFCEHHGGHLVHVDSAYENIFLKDNLRRYYRGENFWMGLTDERLEGYWVYYDTDTTPTFTDWNPTQTEPNGYTKENCAEFREDEGFQWNDRACSRRNEPLCEIDGSSVYVG